MIYRTAHQVNYTVISNALVNVKLPSDAKNVLIWLLSKPKNWKLIKVVIAEALGLSKHRVQQAITILRNLGYLCFYRHHDGSGHWDVYETPRPQNQAQTRVVKPSPNMPTKAFSNDITNTDPNKIKKTTTDAEPLPDQKELIAAHVVVNFEEEKIHDPFQQLEEAATVSDTRKTADPIIVTEVEKLAVTQSIKPTLIKTLAALTLAEAKAVLNILARAIVLGKVQNPVGYAIELSKRAKNGTLTPITANYQPTLSERMAKQEARFKAESERGKVTNEQWVAMMAERGIKVQI